MQRKVDLHIHTTISDGTDTPEEVLLKASAAGISYCSMTDHDAVNVLPVSDGAFVEGASTVICGVEFSCEDELGKYHVLGYGYDPLSEEILALVRAGNDYRIAKAAQRLDFLLSEYGFTFSEEERVSLFALSNPGKPHIANMMVRHGYASTISEAIRDYLNKYHGTERRTRPEEAIRAILTAGGIPVIAHPAYGSGDELILGEALDERMRHLTALGIRGAEAYYSGFSSEIRDHLLTLADRYDLYVTAGSDYHGTNKTVALGDTGLDPDAPLPARLECFLRDVQGR